MSWTMWHVVGMGGIDISEVAPEAYVKFIRNHKVSLARNSFYANAVEKFLASTAKAADAGTITDEDLYDACYDFFSTSSASEPIAVILSQETGIGMDAPGLTDDGEDYVLYCAKTPWCMTEKERALTSYEDLSTILKPYAEELGVPMHDDVDLVYSG